MIHHLKIHLQHYERVKDGTKPFEIRKNDRAFQKWDKVILKPFDPVEQKYYTTPTLPDLVFLVGDVYPIDAERVVFGLIEDSTTKANQ